MSPSERRERLLRRLTHRGEWERLTRRQAADLIDTLRRCAELLGDPQPPSVGELAPHWYGERDYIVAVARRLVREYDPQHDTDLAVTNPGAFR